MPVLVHLGYCNKKYLGQLIITEIYFSQFQRLRSPRSRDQYDHILGKAFFLVHSQYPLNAFSYSVRGQEPVWEFLIRTLILLMRALPSCPKQIPRAFPPNAIIFGGQDFNTYILGYRNSQTISMINLRNTRLV